MVNKTSVAGMDPEEKRKHFMNYVLRSEYHQTEKFNSRKTL